MHVHQVHSTHWDQRSTLDPLGWKLKVGVNHVLGTRVLDCWTSLQHLSHFYREFFTSGYDSIWKIPLSHYKRQNYLWNSLVYLRFVWRLPSPEVGICCLLSCSLTFEVGLSLELNSTDLVRLAASKHQESSYLAFPMMGLQTWSWGLDSGLQVCVALTYWATSQLPYLYLLIITSSIYLILL